MMIMSSGEMAASFSLGKVAYWHDMMRESDNIDRRLSGDNVVLADELKGQSIEAYTNEKFKHVIDEYNAKQRRKDRREINYVSWHNKQPNHCQLAYEYVMQVGNHENIGERYYNSTDEEKKYYHKFYTRLYSDMLEQFKKDYPHIHVLWAVVHFDEPNGTPHLHMGLQPVGEGYKTKLSQRLSVSKATELDGIQPLTKAEIEATGGPLAHLALDFKEKHLLPWIERFAKEINMPVKEPEHGLPHLDGRAFPVYMREQEQRAKELGMDKAQEEYDNLINAISNQRMQFLREQQEHGKVVRERAEELYRYEKQIQQRQQQNEYLQQQNDNLLQQNEDLQQRSEDEYNRLVDIMSDTNYISNLILFHETVRDEQPEYYNNLINDDTNAIEGEWLENQPSEPIQVLDDMFRKFDPLENDEYPEPDIDEIYPLPNKKNRDDHDDR